MNMLAIVIPYYKPDFFEATLQSLAKQSDKHFKVYIGDDASPVPALGLVEKYQDKINCVYRRFDENLGGVSLVAQWDRCLELVKDEQWIMILGDDDSLSDDCVKDFYGNLTEIEANDYNLVRFATKLNDVVNKKLSNLFTHPKQERLTDFFFRRLRNETRSSLSEYIFKKSCYQKHGFHDYNLAWYSDDRAWFEFSEFGCVYSINSSFLNIGLSGENISRYNYRNEEKQQVALQFYHFLVSSKLNEFDRRQRKRLLLYYEQLVYKSNTVSFQFWVLMLVSFISSFYLVESIKFTRRLLIHLNK
jgi:glycosyltransferase involved in cell wall biosynthesis